MARASNVQDLAAPRSRGNAIRE